MRKISLMLAMLLMIFSVWQVNATTYYVKTSESGGSDGNDGLSWATAKATPIAAYDAAVAGDEVWVAAGTYTGISLVLKAGVSIYGGFAGTETDLSERAKGTEAWEFTNETVFEGLGRAFSTSVSTSATNAGNAVLKKTTTETGFDVVIDGLTLTNGEHGVYAAAGDGLTVQNVIIRDNGSLSTSTSGWATTVSLGIDGGGYCSYGSNSLLNSLVEGNKAKSAGGVYQNGATGIVDGCLIRNNQALPPENTITYGYTVNGASNGSVWAYGGGAFIQEGIIQNCRIEHNEAIAGGGVLVRTNATRVYNCVIAYNKAVFGAGLTYDYRNNTAQIHENTWNCLFAYNEAYLFPEIMKGSYDATVGTTGLGAGVYLKYDGQKVNNSIFVGNKLADGTPDIKGDNLNTVIDHCVVDVYNYEDADHETFYVGDASKIVNADLTTYDFFKGINKGLAFTDAATDIVGKARVYGSSIDIGPYEIQPYKLQVVATDGVVITAGSTANGSYSPGTAVTINFTCDIAPYAAVEGPTYTVTSTGGNNYTLTTTLTEPANIRLAPTPKWLTIANVASVSIISTTSEADGTHGGDYPVIEGGDFTMLFKLKNDCQTIAVSEGELSAPTADGVYTWTLRNVTADTNVSFNITTKEYTVTFHIGSGITDLTDDSGDELPALTFTTECGSYYDFWFNVAPGYHSPMVSINGVLLDEAYFYEEDEHYTFYLDEIKQNIDIYLSAFEQYAIPVTYDLDANSAPTGIHSPIIRISRETYGTMAFIKFLTPVDALPTDFNTIELKMKIKTPSTTSGIYPLAWIDNYRSTNSASEATEEEWTEDNYTYATRPLFKQEVDRVTVTPDLTEDLVWKFSESTIADIKTFLEDAQILGTQEALSFRCDPIKIDNVSVRIDVYSREGALTADQMPTIIFKSLPVTTVNTTVTANHVTILSGEGAVQVREGYPYVLSFELESGYENPTVTINGDAYTPTLINDAYQVEISTPPTTMTINVSATKIQVPVTATIGAGVTNVTGVAETVSWGEPLPTITYQLASGYTRTLVVLNNKVVTPTVSGGTYTISVPDSVLATQKLGIYAFTASEYPVSADTHVRGSTFENTNYASVDSLLIEYSVYSIPYYVYHSYLEFPIDASAITAGETVNLRLKLKKVEKPALSPLPVIVSTVPYDSTDPTNTPAAINEVNDMTWFLNGETEYDAATTEIVAQFTVANDAQPGTIYTIELNKSKIAAAVRDGKLRLRLAVANESDDDIDDENDGHIQFYSMEANNPTCVPTIVIGAPKTITVATTHAVVLAGDPTAVTGTAYTLIFKPETGYTHPTVTVNGTAATVTRADSIYTLIVPNVTADLSIDITCSEIVWRTLTVTSSGVTFTKTPPTQIADGDPYTLTFTLQSGYENPVVTVDGTAYTLAAPVNGVYTITIATVSADVTIDIASTNTGLYDVVPQVVAVKYYTLQGMEVRQPSQDGIYIVKRIYDNQQTKVSKEIIRRR
ncbi:MAG: hypothetical protein LBR66_07840 [Candidatus Symbiothrix sp.]|jgi:hypothetical protein|nr:hypothetical protein [Candidatus Symbiothrix sp.]